MSHPGDNFRATEDISDGQDAPAAVTFEPAPRFCAAMIRSVIRYGDPRLLAPNAEADPEAPELPALIADMIETCHAAPGSPIDSTEVRILATLKAGVNPS